MDFVPNVYKCASATTYSNHIIRDVNLGEEEKKREEEKDDDDDKNA